MSDYCIGYTHRFKSNWQTFLVNFDSGDLFYQAVLEHQPSQVVYYFYDPESIIERLGKIVATYYKNRRTKWQIKFFK